MEIGKIEQLEVSEIPTRQASWNTKSVAVDPPDKCCETCGYFVHYSRYCANATCPLIDFGFKLGDGDPAEFWCNHWQQKEAVNGTED